MPGALRYSPPVTRHPDIRPTASLDGLDEVVMRVTAWADPVAVASAFADELYVCVLTSADDGWSYVLRGPDRVMVNEVPADLASLTGQWSPAAQGSPFQGGVLGLAAYELSARLEPTAPQARGDGPDLVLLRYPALLAIHAGERRGLAIGRGPDARTAAARADAALSWLEGPETTETPGALAQPVMSVTPDADHARAVSDTVCAIAAGDLFQANLARPWGGFLKSGASPYDLFRRLARQSPAGYAAYLRLPGGALVSNSPEQFLSVRREGGALWAETAPIKGTRPRGPTPTHDTALAAELVASTKDQAENLMIVDLMRNDLARVCDPGTVTVPERAVLKSYANVHHLVSRVRGRLKSGATAWDAFLAAFPPGSVTGAPKLAAMSVIARYEPPRGAYCGSLFWAGGDGALEASVLIRTVTMTETAAGWAFEARAGGGIVADSDPASEVQETTTKIGAILRALTGAS